MIQRIQSLFLLFVAIVASAGLFMNLYIIDGVSHKVLEDSNMTLALSLMSTLALVTLFMFGNRKLQIKLCYGLMVLSLVLASFMGMSYTSNAINFNKVLFSIPATTFIFAFLAQVNIKKDLKLVESADRLR